LKEALARAVGYGGRLGADYVEVRVQRNFKTLLTTKDGRVEAAKDGIENGAAVRVLAKGAWGFVTLGTLDPRLLADAVKEAFKMASVASFKVKEPVRLAETKTIEDKVTAKPRKDPREIPLDEKIGVALTINNTIFDYDDRVKSCTIDYLDLTGTNYFMNSDGTYLEQDRLYVWSRIFASAREADVFTSGREEIGSTAGFEVFDVETPEIVGTRIAKRIVDQLEAKVPKGGTFPAVIGTNVVGVFVHEAFGHLAEADLTLSGSVLYNKLERKIASEAVTVYDDGTISGALGSFKYDDEGVPAQKTLLIKEGEVAGLMHNRETAHKFDTTSTGNARAEDFRSEPIIRMRNTYLASGGYAFEELLEDIDFGYYLKSFRGGEANLDGTFQVGIEEAYEIVKGELGSPVRNVSISGNTLETLHKVEAAGRDFQLWPGRCGKGQIAFVCDGGPSIRVREVLFGGGA